MKRLILAVMIVAVAVLMLVGCAKKDAKQAEAQVQELSGPHIAWVTDMDKALEQAAAEHKPLMIDFMATWCPPCKKMEDSTFTHSLVIEKAKSFVPVRIDVDQQAEVANHYKSNASKYGGIGIPNILFLDAHGHELKHPVGYQGPEVFLAIMDSVLTEASQHHH